MAEITQKIEPGSLDDWSLENHSVARVIHEMEAALAQVEEKYRKPDFEQMEWLCDYLLEWLCLEWGQGGTIIATINPNHEDAMMTKVFDLAEVSTDSPVYGRYASREDAEAARDKYTAPLRAEIERIEAIDLDKYCEYGPPLTRVG